MGLVRDRFDSSGIWAEVEAAATLLQDSELPDDSGERETYEETLRLLGELRERRTTTDAHLVTATMLQTILGDMQQVHSIVGQWVSRQVPASHVRTFLDQTYDHLATWPPRLPLEYLRGVEDATERYREAVDKKLESLHDSTVDLSNQLTEASVQRESLSASIATEQQNLAAARAEFEKQAAAELLASQERWAAEREAQKELAEQRLVALEGLESDARDLVHASTSSLVAHDYGKYARNKTVAAWVCDVAAGAIGIAGVFAILYHLYRSDPGADGDVGLSLTRLAASLGTLGVAALVGRRGQQHHREARAAKRTDLALQKVGPFISTLDPEEQQSIVRNITERVFIKGELDNAPPPAPLLDSIASLRPKKEAGE